MFEQPPTSEVFCVYKVKEACPPKVKATEGEGRRDTMVKPYKELLHANHTRRDDGFYTAEVIVSVEPGNVRQVWGGGTDEATAYVRAFSQLWRPELPTVPQAKLVSNGHLLAEVVLSNGDVEVKAQEEEVHKASPAEKITAVGKAVEVAVFELAKSKGK